MRVWLITTGEPVPVSGGRHERLHRTGMFAAFLAEHGHAVTWWTSTFDHFRKEHLFDRDTELAIRNDLTVRLLHGSGYQKNLSYARIRDHQQVAARFAACALEESPPDIIVAALPTIELSLAAMNYGKERGAPVVLDMRDMWPDIFVRYAPAFAQPLARLVLSPMFRKAHLACAGATATIGITDAFVNWGLQRGGRRKSDLDRSFPFAYSAFPPDAKDLAAAEAKWEDLGIRSDDGCLNVCFFGSIGRQFDLGPAISAVRLMSASGAKTRLIICGTGERLMEYRAMASSAPSVLFPGWVNAAEIWVLMRRSSVGLDPMPDRCDFLSTINNKAIEYVSAGLPVISSPNRGVLHELLTREQCGLTYPHGDAGALAGILWRLIREPRLRSTLSRNAARVFAERFAADKVCQDMMDHLDLVVERTRKKGAAAGEVSVRC